MKRIFLVACLIVLAAGLFLPTRALAADLAEDKIVVGGTWTLKSGEVLDGSVVIFGGTVALETDSRVDGDVALLGGTLEVSGEVEQDIVSMGGLVELKESAVVHGNVVTVGSRLVRESGARVYGQVNIGSDAPMSFTFPGRVTMPRLRMDFSPVVNLMWFMMRVFMWAALGVLLAVFLPRHIRQTAETAVRQPVASGGLGLLTGLIAPFVLVILVITLCLIPAAIFGAIGLVVAWAFGMVALGWETGRRLAKLVNQEWSEPVAAGIGTFILIFITDGSAALIPCIGWVLPIIAGFLALGAVILTRFGTQPYPPMVDADFIPPAPPTPPTPPTPPLMPFQKGDLAVIDSQAPAMPPEIANEPEDVDIPQPPQRASQLVAEPTSFEPAPKPARKKAAPRPPVVKTPGKPAAKTGARKSVTKPAEEKPTPEPTGKKPGAEK